MDNIVLTYKSCSLKQSDLLCLSSYKYLNDIIISFYYEILNEKYNINANKITLLDPAVSMSIILQNNLRDIKDCIFDPLDLSNKEFVFAPVNDNSNLEYKTSGSHWGLLLILVKKNLIFYFDSLKHDIDNSHILHKRLEKLFKKKFAFIYAIDNTYQFNSFDCGMFVLGFTESIIDYLTKNNYQFSNLNIDENYKFDNLLSNYIYVNQDNMQNFRNEILNIINKKIDQKK